MKGSTLLRPRIILGVALVVLGLYGATHFSGSKSNLQVEASSHGTVKFFGYYWAGMDPWVQTISYLNEVAPYTNIIELLHFDPILLDRAAQMKQKGMKVIYPAGQCFFYDDGAGWRLRSNWQTTWAACRATIDQILQRTPIFAFYVMDEPTGNGLTIQEIETASYALKQAYPQIKTWITESDVPPTMARWVDIYSKTCYASVATCQAAYEVLKARWAGEIWVTAQAYQYTGLPDLTVEFQQQIWNWVRSDPRFSGIVWFLYADANGSDIPGRLAGTRRFPAIKAYHETIGKNDVLCNNTWENNPVCGINGVTYQNPDKAKCANVAIASYGQCTVSCFATPPGNLTTASITANSAGLSWTPGTGGGSQLLRAGPDLSDVLIGCPGGTCVVATTLPSTTTNSYSLTNLNPVTTYHWRVVTYKDQACWKDAVSSFTTPLNSVPIGWLDSANQNNNGLIVGWTFDPDYSSASNYVHIYEGPAGAGGTFIASAQTNVLRQDVNTAYGITGNHGYVVTIPAQYRDGREHAVYVYGSDLDGGPIAPLSGSPKSFIFPVDITSPTVAIISPSNGASVSGRVLVTATAADNVGVTKVEFYVDSTLVGTDTTTPYSYQWDTSVFSVGSVHTLHAKAYDGASNVATSPSISVTIAQATSTDKIPPQVAITSPTNGVQVSGTVPIIVSATDNVGVARVDFYVDSVFKSSDISPPHSYQWDASQLPAGSVHAFSAEAYDAASNSATSSLVYVKIFQSSSPPPPPPPPPLPLPSPQPTPSGTFPPTPSPTSTPQTKRTPILRNLYLGSRGDDVKTIQDLLIKEGVYPEKLVTGYFGPLTKRAVIRFQEKYATDVLKPAGLTKGTGFVGPLTRAKLNKIYSL